MADYEDEWYDDQKPSKGHKEVKAKNKMPAPVQITAEQLLREAKERELEVQPAPPQQKISSEAELKEYQLRKRKDFEDNIRKSRVNMQTWIRYAGFEEKQGELHRARSVFERALDVDPRNVGVWMRYAEMEMRAKQINHARNVWDRAVTILPRADQFWYRYAYMEELVGNVAGARQVFERWMEWEPPEQAWHTYINFEIRYKELDRARVIYERFVIAHPEEKNWIKYAKFEERHGFVHSARRIFERSDEFFETQPQARLLIEFARFEERQKEHERARVIYKYALDNLQKEECEEIYKAYTIHEKKFGDRVAIEDVIVSKKKFQYEEQVTREPTNYDAWFDYIRLMEPEDGEECNLDEVREVYERAIANVPPILEKRHWRRYIYLWINYALFEELIAEDVERCRQVYRMCIEELLPHKKFTFSKMWLLWAKFEIRQKEIARARKILGSALGRCPTTKLFREYIQLELDLREFDRCRKLYEKFIEFAPENCTTWMRFAEMESMLGETERARGIFDLAINQPMLDMPELLWKTYIDFERENGELDRTRALYRALLHRTSHVKVWVSLAHFELTCETALEADSDDDEEEEGGQARPRRTDEERQEALSAAHAAGVLRAREVYREANRRLREADEKEHRVRLLEMWRDFEAEFGDSESQAAVAAQMPERIKRRRRRPREDGGEDAGEWEEYFDYVFPDAEGNQPNLRLLAMAAKWKKQRLEPEPGLEENPDADTDIEDDDDDDDEEEEDDDEEMEEGKEGKGDSDSS